MRVVIKATGMSLTPSIEEYVGKKVANFEKYFSSLDPENVIANVEVARTTRHHKSGEIFKAEIFIRAGGHEYYAVAEAEDLYAAIDICQSEVGREITSWKGRSKTLLRRGGAKIKNLIKRLNWKNK